MKTKVLLLGLTLLIIAVIGYLARQPPAIGSEKSGPGSAANAEAKVRMNDPRSVVLRISASRPTNAVAQGSDKLLSFEILNHGHSPIMCPDGWYLEFEDGKVLNLSLPQSGNIRVEPGKIATLVITNPVPTNPWRLGASYYQEDVVFDVKVRIDQSALKNHLPQSLSSVRGKNVTSDWIK